LTVRPIISAGEHGRERAKGKTYGNAVCILLADALGLSLPLLERVLVLELGSHLGGDFFASGETRKSNLLRVDVEICVVVFLKSESVEGERRDGFEGSEGK
jgi:hypothetical protein